MRPARWSAPSRARASCPRARRAPRSPRLRSPRARAHRASGETSSAQPARPPARRRRGCGRSGGRARSAPRAPAPPPRRARRPAPRRRDPRAGRAALRPARARAPPAPRRARPRPLHREPQSMFGILAEDRVQLVLEAAVLDRAVHAALLGRIRLPPPAAGAVVLALADRARARRAADRRVTLRVQPVNRHVVLAEIRPDFALRPLGERIQLHDRAVIVV